MLCIKVIALFYRSLDYQGTVLMISQYIEVLILSFIQGFSEFIPVSSSGHLIIVSEIYKFNVGSLQLDIAFHLGSLFAIIFYFRNDLLNITKSFKYRVFYKY